MSIESILITGAIILACGCAGLLMVRLDNPRLLGLGWLGAALGTGGTGAVLLLLNGLRSPLLSILLPDLFVLGAFVLMHVAVMELVTLRGVPAIGLLLLALQAAADIYKIHGHMSWRFRITVIGLLITVQAAQTVLLLLRRAETGIRSPARFISTVLAGFISWNLFRSLATATGLFVGRTFGGRPLEDQVQAFTYVLYLAAALGLAFGFFWMTTAGLTAKLEDLANTDTLTRVLNRRAFMRCYEEECNRSQRSGDSFALVMLDLDHFKAVNDRHGHTVGDEVLCATVRAIQNATRGIDAIGRWGGEEFVVLLPGANDATAKIAAERIRSNIQRSASLSPGSKHIPVTASLGIAVWCAEDSMEAIFRRADDALYSAKSAGRNCVIVAASHTVAEAAQYPLILVKSGQA